MCRRGYIFLQGIYIFECDNIPCLLFQYFQAHFSKSSHEKRSTRYISFFLKWNTTGQRKLDKISSLYYKKWIHILGPIIKSKKTSLIISYSSSISLFPERVAWVEIMIILIAIINNNNINVIITVEFIRPFQSLSLGSRSKLEPFPLSASILPTKKSYLQ